MSVICPKCNYPRSPADQAPDYECPKCGIVYDKVRDESETETAPQTSPEPAFRPLPKVTERKTSLFIYCLVILAVIGGVIFYLNRDDTGTKPRRADSTAGPATGPTSSSQAADWPRISFSPDGRLSVDLPVSMSPVKTIGISSAQVNSQKSYRGASESLEVHVSTVEFSSFFALDLETTWQMMETELILKRYMAVERNIRHKDVEKEGLRKKIVSGTFLKETIAVFGNLSHEFGVEGALIAKDNRGWSVLIIANDPSLRPRAARLIRNIRISDKAEKN